MKGFLVLFCILMLMFSLDTIAKDAFSFEPYEYPDTVTEYGMEPFTTGYRESELADFVVVEDEKWWHGSHSVAIHMTHEGPRWLIFAKNARENGQNDALDTTFLHELDNRDTLFYYLYVPWGAPIDSIFIFVRNTSWAHDLHTVYHASDLHYGRWNELKDGISDTSSDGSDFAMPLVQSDFEIHTTPGVNPACTLYLDAVSSKGRVPQKYADTTGQAGIDIGNGLLSVSKSSINCIEYALGGSSGVMVQLYDLTGSKKLEVPVGIQVAGTYRIPLDLAPGVYFGKVSADDETEIVKVICIK